MISMLFSCASGIEGSKSKISTTEEEPVATITPIPTVPYENFLEPIQKIDRKYVRFQKKFERTKQRGRYVYEMISMSTFPFFCLPGNQKPDPKYTPIYSDKYLSIFYHKDSVEHIQVAYLNYILLGSKYPPKVKVYVLYSMKKDVIQGWVEEHIPVIVTLKWNSSGEHYYSP